MSQESKKIRSRDRRIFEKNPYYEIKTLTHNDVKIFLVCTRFHNEKSLPVRQITRIMLTKVK